MAVRGVSGLGGSVAKKGEVGLEGMKELNKALKQLPDKLQERAIKNAMADGARAIRDEAKRRAPVDDGDLRDSIVVSRTVQVKGRRQSVKGGVVIGIKGAPRFYAHIAEFGTSRQTAQPFLRPAFDAKQEEALKRIGPKLGKEIEKQARKLNEMSGAKRRKAFARSR